MAGTKPIEFEGITLVFDGEMPTRGGARKGTTKYDPIVQAIRDHAKAGVPVFLQGMKPANVTPLKRKYPDISFITRGGKENPTVWAVVGELENLTV